jgi:hypothetical protein
MGPAIVVLTKFVSINTRKEMANYTAADRALLIIVLIAITLNLAASATTTALFVVNWPTILNSVDGINEAVEIVKKVGAMFGITV